MVELERAAGKSVPGCCFVCGCVRACVRVRVRAGPLLRSRPPIHTIPTYSCICTCPGPGPTAGHGHGLAPAPAAAPAPAPASTRAATPPPPPRRAPSSVTSRLIRPLRRPPLLQGYADGFLPGGNVIQDDSNYDPPRWAFKISNAAVHRGAVTNGDGTVYNISFVREDGQRFGHEMNYITHTTWTNGYMFLFPFTSDQKVDGSVRHLIRKWPPPPRLPLLLPLPPPPSPPPLPQQPPSPCIAVVFTHNIPLRALPL